MADTVWNATVARTKLTNRHGEEGMAKAGVNGRKTVSEDKKDVSP